VLPELEEEEEEVNSLLITRNVCISSGHCQGIAYCDILQNSYVQIIALI